MEDPKLMNSRPPPCLPCGARKEEEEGEGRGERLRRDGWRGRGKTIERIWLERVPGARVRRRAGSIDGRDKTRVDEGMEGRDAHLTAATARRAVRLEARHLVSLAPKTRAVNAFARTTRRAPPLLTFGLAAGRCATDVARFTSRERARSVFPGGVSPEARAGRTVPLSDGNAASRVPLGVWRPEGESESPRD